MAHFELENASTKEPQQQQQQQQQQARLASQLVAASEAQFYRLFKQRVQAIDTKLEEHLSAARDQSAMKAYWTGFLTEQLNDMQEAIGNDLDSAQQAFEDMSGRINGLLASARPVLVPTAGAHGDDYAAGLGTTRSGQPHFDDSAQLLEQQQLQQQHQQQNGLRT